MEFNFGDVAGKAQSSSKAVLKGNEIHTVKFIGCEARDIQGVKDTTAVYPVLDIKFENEKGYFTHTIWPLKETDFEDRVSPNGIKNPSNVTTIKYLFFHLLQAVNPELHAKILSGEKKLAFKAGKPDEIWAQLRQVFVKATEAGKGKEVEIKLITNNKGEAIFPYFLSYNKAGELYMSTNFIGQNLGFTAKEQARINKIQTAAPTKATASDGLAMESESNDESDLDFNL